MATNQYKSFATDPAAALLPIDAYVQDTQGIRTKGNIPGSMALSTLVNRAARQASVMAEALGEVIVEAGQDALDNGDAQALKAGIKVGVAKIIEDSGEIPDVATMGYRNALINGDFQLAQWTTMGSAVGYQSVDRWRVNTASTLRQETALATIQGLPGAVACASLTATGSAMSVAQRIENAAIFSGSKATLSFYAKGSKSMNVSLNVTRSAGGSITLTKQISITTEWQKYAVTFDIPLITSAISEPANTYLQVEFSGTGVVANDKLYLGLAQMEEGEMATPFERRNPAFEEQLAGRYAESGNLNSNAMGVVSYYPYASEIYYLFQKRATPSVKLPVGGVYFGQRDGSARTPSNLSASVVNNSKRKFAYASGPASGNTDYLSRLVCNADYNYFADAEL